MRSEFLSSGLGPFRFHRYSAMLYTLSFTVLMRYAMIQVRWNLKREARETIAQPEGVKNENADSPITTARGYTVLDKSMHQESRTTPRRYHTRLISSPTTYSTY